MIEELKELMLKREDATRRWSEIKLALKEKEARLQLYTDWDNVLNVKPTVAAKDSYIQLECSELHEDLIEAETTLQHYSDAVHLKELEIRIGCDE